MLFRSLDLNPIEGAGHPAAALDELVAERVKGVSGGIADQILRLVIHNVPRHVGREMNHAAIRGYMAEALHFQLDLRRPEAHREVGLGAPGRRQTLPEIVAAYLSRRPLPAELDRAAFVQLGTGLIDAVERDWAES